MLTPIMISGATVIDTYTGAKAVRDVLIESDRIVQVKAPGERVSLFPVGGQ